MVYARLSRDVLGETQPYGPIAKLAKATVCKTVIRRFESGSGLVVLPPALIGLGFLHYLTSMVRASLTLKDAE